MMKKPATITILMLIVLVIVSCKSETLEVYIARDTSVTRIYYKSKTSLESEEVSNPGIPMTIIGTTANYVPGVYIKQNGKFVEVRAVCVINSSGTWYYADERTGKGVIEHSVEVLYYGYNNGGVYARSLTTNDLLYLNKAEYIRMHALAEKKAGFVILY